MIKCLYRDKKLRGFIDGKSYLNEKKKLWGYLDGNIAKDKEGYPLLILQEDGIITWNEGEEQGSLQENKIFNLNGKLLYEFNLQKRQILDNEGNPILFLEGETRELEQLTNLDFFGITAIILELFA